MDSYVISWSWSPNPQEFNLITPKYNDTDYAHQLTTEIVARLIVENTGVIVVLSGDVKI